MLQSVVNKSSKEKEGYIYTIYGKSSYLRHVIASVHTLRRYDSKRPIALVCEDNHVQLLKKWGLTNIFEEIISLDPRHRSIVGFKHNVDAYMVFQKNIFLDSDILWCKNPDGLWQSLNAYSFTITGNVKADHFFGASKNMFMLIDILLNKRKKTLEKFGLSYLSRVQSGMIYASDLQITKRVCKLARFYFTHKDETHFRSRKLPNGHTEESDEWAFAMALSKLKLPVIPWYNDRYSPQIDYIKSRTEHDKNFNTVQCLVYPEDFVNNLKGIQNPTLRKCLIKACGIIPSYKDYKWITPYSIHFGWKREKQPFLSFSERMWDKITKKA